MADRSIIFVQSIPGQADEKVLKNAFGIFGDIRNIKINREKQTALIDFFEEGDADAAIDNMHLSELFGETIYVSYATKGNLTDKSKPIWDGHL